MRVHSQLEEFSVRIDSSSVLSDGADVARLADEVHDGQVLLPLLKVFGSQSHHLMASQGCVHILEVGKRSDRAQQNQIATRL